MTSTFDLFDTELGWVAAVINQNGATRTTLPEPSEEKALEQISIALSEGSRTPDDEMAQLRNTVQRYCAGKKTDLSKIPVDYSDATPFFQEIWNACRTIPVGETRSYRWLAIEAGNPAAVRACGQAMARNRLPLLVPCHRVIGSDGKLHGFGGSLGLTMKQRLLDLEQSWRN